MDNEIHHASVLLNDVVNLLNLKEDGIYVDATVGAGGHSEKILEKLSKGLLIGIDQDDGAICIAKRRLSKFSTKNILIKDNFRNLKDVLNKLKIRKIDGVLFDLGVSTFQLKSKERGFSFNIDGPLDMRMDKSEKINAYELVNLLREDEIADIIYKYGEERFSKRIARAIVNARTKSPIKTTQELAKIIKDAIPYYPKNWKINPATRTFQALRIAVNKELEILPNSINDAVDMLSLNGRICVISFHSLEDRCIKNIFREHLKLKIITKKPVVPSLEEKKNNPSARSGKLRCAEKTNE